MIRKESERKFDVCRTTPGTDGTHFIFGSQLHILDSYHFLGSDNKYESPEKSPQ